MRYLNDIASFIMIVRCVQELCTITSEICSFAEAWERGYEICTFAIQSILARGGNFCPSLIHSVWEVNRIHWCASFLNTC